MLAALVQYSRVFAATLRRRTVWTALTLRVSPWAENSRVMALTLAKSSGDYAALPRNNTWPITTVLFQNNTRPGLFANAVFNLNADYAGTTRDECAVTENGRLLISGHDFGAYTRYSCCAPTSANLRAERSVVGVNPCGGSLDLVLPTKIAAADWVIDAMSTTDGITLRTALEDPLGAVDTFLFLEARESSSLGLYIGSDNAVWGTGDPYTKTFWVYDQELDLNYKFNATFQLIQYTSASTDEHTAVSWFPTSSAAGPWFMIPVSAEQGPRWLSVVFGWLSPFEGSSRCVSVRVELDPDTLGDFEFPEGFADSVMRSTRCTRADRAEAWDRGVSYMGGVDWYYLKVPQESSDRFRGYSIFPIPVQLQRSLQGSDL